VGQCRATATIKQQKRKQGRKQKLLALQQMLNAFDL
jgi:hypothetical protein